MRAWRKEWRRAEVRREIGRARQALRDFRADLAIDLMGNHKAGALAWLSGAPRRLGAAKPHRREPSSALWINEPVEVNRHHAVDRGLDLLEPLGVDPQKVDFGAQHLLPQPPPETTDLLARQSRPYAVIQAGAGWANKTWPSAWFGQVAQEIARRTDHDVLVPIAPGEEHLAQAVVEHSDGAARAVDAGPFSALAAILRGSRLVLGGDTGPIHMADALGVPVLCLIGPTDPKRNGPYHGADGVLWHQLPCSCCYKRFDEPKACLLHLTPDLVARRACELLERGEGLRSEAGAV